MTLKQQFIEMAKIILANYPDYEIETDYTVGYCKEFKDSSPITDCYECDVTGCSGRIKQKVDVMISDPAADFYAYYIFNQPKDKASPEDIHYINSSKAMFKALSNLKSDVEQYDRYRLEYLDRCDVLREYAKEFAATLKNDYFDLFDIDHLPIIFHDDMKDYAEITSGMITGGEVSGNLFQLTINIYNVEDNEIEKLKQNIRHELIHYALRVCGLKSSDDSAIFHILCNRYNANAYEEMTADEKLLFDEWTNIVTFAINVFMDKDVNILDECVNESLKYSMLGLGASNNCFTHYLDIIQKHINSCSQTLDIWRNTIESNMSMAAS